jgi:hypothetical protein
MKQLLGLALTIASTLALTGPADAADADALATHQIAPVILDGEDGAGATLGLEYTLRNKKVLRNFDGGGDPNDLGSAADVRLGDLRLSYDAGGTIAAAEDRNPANLLHALVDLQFLGSWPKFGSASGGVFFKYETDQGFEDQQSQYGLRLTYVKLKIFRDLDWLAIDVNRGQIDPEGDEGRAAALGTSDLTRYYRTNIEVIYQLPIEGKLPLIGAAITSLELNYRYFRESGAPDAVRAANLDTFSMRKIRLNLVHDLFIAYADGRLPFDLKDDKFVELGLTYEIE